MIETTTYIMGGKRETDEFKSDLETLELTTMKLDSMLFEIPPGYKEAKSEDELQEKLDINEMMKQYQQNDQGKEENNKVVSGEKKAGMIRIGVYEPKNDGQLQGPLLQQHIVTMLYSGNVEAVAVASEEDARTKNCDMVLSTDFLKVKQASKVGGLLKAVKNNDPSAAVSFNIEASMMLTSLTDGSVRSKQNVNGKFEGQADEAAKKSLDKGCELLLKDLK